MGLSNGAHHWSEKQYHSLFKEEQILNFCASCPLKPIHIFEKPVICDTNMYRIKGIKCVWVKDSCSFEHVRIAFSRSPEVPLIYSIPKILLGVLPGRKRLLKLRRDRYNCMYVYKQRKIQLLEIARCENCQNNCDLHGVWSWFTPNNEQHLVDSSCKPCNDKHDI